MSQIPKLKKKLRFVIWGDTDVGRYTWDSSQIGAIYYFAALAITLKNNHDGLNIPLSVSDTLSYRHLKLQRSQWNMPEKVSDTIQLIELQQLSRTTGRADVSLLYAPGQSLRAYVDLNQEKVPNSNETVQSYLESCNGIIVCLPLKLSDEPESFERLGRILETQKSEEPDREHDDTNINNEKKIVFCALNYGDTSQSIDVEEYGATIKSFMDDIDIHNSHYSSGNNDINESIYLIEPAKRSSNQKSVMLQSGKNILKPFSALLDNFIVIEKPHTSTSRRNATSQSNQSARNESSTQNKLTLPQSQRRSRQHFSAQSYFIDYFYYGKALLSNGGDSGWDIIEWTQNIDAFLDVYSTFHRNYQLLHNSNSQVKADSYGVAIFADTTRVKRVIVSDVQRTKDTDAVNRPMLLYRYYLIHDDIVAHTNYNPVNILLSLRAQGLVQHDRHTVAIDSPHFSRTLKDLRKPAEVLSIGDIPALPTRGSLENRFNMGVQIIGDLLAGRRVVLHAVEEEQCLEFVRDCLFLLPPQWRQFIGVGIGAVDISQNPALDIVITETKWIAGYGGAVARYDFDTRDRLTPPHDDTSAYDYEMFLQSMGRINNFNMFKHIDELELFSYISTNNDDVKKIIPDFSNWRQNRIHLIRQVPAGMIYAMPIQLRNNLRRPDTNTLWSDYFADFQSYNRAEISEYFVLQQQDIETLEKYIEDAPNLTAEVLADYIEEGQHFKKDNDNTRWLIQIVIARLGQLPLHDNIQFQPRLLQWSYDYIDAIKGYIPIIHADLLNDLLNSLQTISSRFQLMSYMLDKLKDDSNFTVINDLNELIDRRFNDLMKFDTNPESDLYKYRDTFFENLNAIDENILPYSTPLNKLQLILADEEHREEEDSYYGEIITYLREIYEKKTDDLIKALGEMTLWKTIINHRNFRSALLRTQDKQSKFVKAIQELAGEFIEENLPIPLRDLRQALNDKPEDGLTFDAQLGLWETFLKTSDSLQELMSYWNEVGENDRLQDLDSVFLPEHWKDWYKTNEIYRNLLIKMLIHANTDKFYTSFSAIIRFIYQYHADTNNLQRLYSFAKITLDNLHHLLPNIKLQDSDQRQDLDRCFLEVIPMLTCLSQTSIQALTKTSIWQDIKYNVSDPVDDAMVMLIGQLNNLTDDISQHPATIIRNLYLEQYKNISTDHGSDTPMFYWLILLHQNLSQVNRTRANARGKLQILNIDERIIKHALIYEIAHPNWKLIADESANLTINIVKNTSHAVVGQIEALNKFQIQGFIERMRMTDRKRIVLTLNNQADYDDMTEYALKPGMRISLTSICLEVQRADAIVGGDISRHRANLGTQEMLFLKQAVNRWLAVLLILKQKQPQIFKLWVLDWQHSSTYHRMQHKQSNLFGLLNSYLQGDEMTNTSKLLGFLKITDYQTIAEANFEYLHGLFDAT